MTVNEQGLEAARKVIIGNPLNDDQLSRIITAYLRAASKDAEPVIGELIEPRAWIAEVGENMQPCLCWTEAVALSEADGDGSRITPLFTHPSTGVDGGAVRRLEWRYEAADGAYKQQPLYAIDPERIIALAEFAIKAGEAVEALELIREEAAKPVAYVTPEALRQMRERSFGWASHMTTPEATETDKDGNAVVPLYSADLIAALQQQVEALTKAASVTEPAAESFHARMVAAEAKVVRLTEALLLADDALQAEANNRGDEDGADAVPVKPALNAIRTALLPTDTDNARKE